MSPILSVDIGNLEAFLSFILEAMTVALVSALVLVEVEVKVKVKVSSLVSQGHRRCREPQKP